MARRTPQRPETIEAVVDAVMDGGRVIYVPVKHYSPACAHHVRRLILAVRPVGVLIEGPDDATGLIPHIIDEATAPPLTLFSYYLDKTNRFDMNGVMSADADTPARFRAWWPMTAHAPEYQAMRAGAEVGAQLAFIDLPLHATIPYHHIPLRQAERLVQDRHLAENAWFEALARRQRVRSFDAFWQATFEVGGFEQRTDAFIRQVLTFAECTRSAEPTGASLEADGTLAREAHMRAGLDRFLKAVPEGPVVVVTGAFHSVALPFCAPARKKVRSDRNQETFLTVHSYRALRRLYHLSPTPGYAHAVWEAGESGHARPFDEAAVRTLLGVLRRARELGEPLSTADGVAAFAAARGLAELRGHTQVALEDVRDAATMCFVKGDLRVRGGAVKVALDDVLGGDRVGRITDAAGQPPLLADFYAQCKGHRIDTTGADKTVRCDVNRRDAHRARSAFLHQCDALDIPMFGDLEGRGVHFRGPDPVEGVDLHLISEAWAVRWSVDVDDRLVELSDHGASVAQVAETLLADALRKAEGNAADTTRCLLRAARMGLTGMFDALLVAVESSLVVDWRFDHLATALADFLMLYAYRDFLPTHGDLRLLTTLVTIYGRAVLALPQLAHVAPEDVARQVDLLQSLVRITLTFDAVDLDRQLLAERLHELTAVPDGTPQLRGAAFGVLFALGATRDKTVARELAGYLAGTPDRVLQAGPFLEGLFATARSIVLGSRRLLGTIDTVLGAVDADTFKLMLPDMRRAFTGFIPSEIDGIAARLRAAGGAEPEAPSPAVVGERLRRTAATADARIQAALDLALAGGRS